MDNKESKLGAKDAKAPQAEQPPDVSLIEDKVRPAITEALSASANVNDNVGADVAAEDPRLSSYHQQYAALSEGLRAHCTWEGLVSKLTANNSEKLKKAEAMLGGGHLFYIETNGEVLIKDKGSEPLMYIKNVETGKMIPTLSSDRQRVANSDEFTQGKIQWASGHELIAQVDADGYDLFEDDGHYGFSDSMTQAATVNDSQLFVASDSKQETRSSLLKNTRRAWFDPNHNGGDVTVQDTDLEGRFGDTGVIRQLRV